MTCSVVIAAFTPEKYECLRAAETRELGHHGFKTGRIGSDERDVEVAEAEVRPLRLVCLDREVGHEL